MADLIHVRINSPSKIIWEGDARSVSSTNTEGAFDILSMHANFITILEKREIVVRTDSEEKKYSFDRSVIYAHSNKVFIYTDL
jgi:F0F1-type ATP synthase epsilon subunit